MGERGAVSPIEAKPELRQQLAELLAAGYDRPQIASALGIHKDTVTKWSKDPRVQGHLTRLIQERINRMTRKIDAAIEERIRDLKHVELDELIKLRKELLPPAPQRLQVTQGVSMDDAMAEMYKHLAENPEVAEALGLGEATAPVGELESGDE